MPTLGLMLPSEEHTPRALLGLAVRAEEAGFDYVTISDHFHPWTKEQGHSPFVWSVLGAIAAATDAIRVGTAVTCPTIRMHPAIIAQASATAAAMMPGRFFLGLGSGENLNEHITGEPWPPPASRLEMLEEAIGIIRDLWSGGEVSHEGSYYTVNRATLFTLPPEPPPIFVAAASPASVRLAASNDGLITTDTEPEMIATFEDAGGKGKPRIAQVGFCWDTDPEAAVQIAHRQWPIAALPWSAKTDLSTPEGFEAIAELVRPGDVASALPCGPDLEPILERVRTAIDAGFDHVTLHQVGPNVAQFIDLFEKELAPAISA